MTMVLRGTAPGQPASIREKTVLDITVIMTMVLRGMAPGQPASIREKTGPRGTEFTSAVHVEPDHGLMDVPQC